jgi:putative GTP pyrophosphokinase
VADESDDSKADHSYEEATRYLDEFGVALCGVVRLLLDNAGIRVHSIEHRVKTADSAYQKLSGEPGKYDGFAALTDLLGLRIITYFADQVDRVAEVLVPEFDIDLDNSVDKRELLDIDRFGYMSLHFVARLEGERSKLIEYSRFTGLCFELQIRSILQHAWAEIEHDLGYKIERSLPPNTRRRFSQLAGVLELVDDQFTALRDERDEYKSAVTRLSSESPRELGVDQFTVMDLLRHDVGTLAVDRDIADLVFANLATEPAAEVAARRAVQLNRVGISNVEELRSLMAERREKISRFAALWLDIADDEDAARKFGERLNPVSRGVGLLFLQYTIGIELPPAERSEWAAGFFEKKDEEDIKARLERIAKLWNQVKRELGDASQA